MREIALDTETTGLDPNSGHRIVEIGCVEMIGHIRTDNAFHVYINPERDMPREAEAIHGISSEFLKDKPVFSAVAQQFVDFIGDSSLVIHNAGFDMKFINAELSSVDIPPVPMDRAIDTVQIARRKFPGQPANLDALCRRFNIDLSARVKHGALLDAELLADVYLELMGGRQASMSLNSNADITQTVQLEQKLTVKTRHFAISDEERSAHQTFLEQLSNPLWKKLEAIE
jgi:DNA polymerase-3 subunit epsilon